MSSSKSSYFYTMVDRLCGSKKGSKNWLLWKSFSQTLYYSSRDKFKIVSHWRPEWCQRVTFTMGLVVALKHFCTKFEVSRCWGHGTQDTRKLRSLKKCRTALQAELPVTMQLQFWKGEAPCTATGFCVRCQKRKEAAGCLCLRFQWQLFPFVLGVRAACALH